MRVSREPNNAVVFMGLTRSMSTLVTLTDDTDTVNGTASDASTVISDNTLQCHCTSDTDWVTGVIKKANQGVNGVLPSICVLHVLTNKQRLKHFKHRKIYIGYILLCRH